MKRLFFRAAALGAALALPVLLPACSSGSKAAPGAPSKGRRGARGARGARKFPVRVLTVRAQPLRYVIETTGTVEARNVYRIDAQVAGVVEGMGFNEGDEVTPRSVLARLSPATYRLNVARAEAARRKAEADLADADRRLRNEVARDEVKLREAEIEVKRRRIVRKSGAISAEEVQLFQSKYDLAEIVLQDAREKVKTVLNVLRAALGEQEAALKEAGENQRKSIVRPPIAGVIEQRLVTNGQYITAGTPIAVLVDRHGLKLKFTLPERESAQVHAGDGLTFRVPAYPGQALRGTVYRIGDLADAQSRQVTCWARIEPSDAKLKAGFFATIRIVTQKKGNALVVPLRAVQPTEQGFVAYVVQQGRAVRRTLQLGLHVAGRGVEVLSGLHAGETIVSDGANALHPDAPLRVLEGEKKKGQKKKSEGPKEKRSVKLEAL